MKPIVFDNIIFSLQRAGGISRVWSDMLTYVAPNLKAFRVLEYAHAMDNFERIALSDHLLFKGEAGKLPVALERMLPARFDSDDECVFHSSYYRLPHCKKAKTVLTVHDFTVERFSNSFMFMRSQLHKGMKRRAIRSADAIVCISESTRNDLLRLNPGVSPGKVHVIYNAVSSKFSRLQSAPHPDMADTVLFVGGRQSYKNFHAAVQAVQRTNLRFCICGSPVNEREQNILNTQLADRWVNLVYPNDEVLNKIYNSAYALLYPSKWEGFGLPVAEARRAGCPVVALRSSAVAEVATDCPSLCDSDAPEVLADALKRLGNQSFRMECIAHGLADKRFTAEDFANGYLNIYDSL